MTIRRETTGAVALTTLMGIGLIVAALATAIGLVAFIEGYIGYGQRQSNAAYFAAQAGTEDAIRRLLMHPDCPTTSQGYSCTGNLTFPVGSGNASTTIYNNTPQSNYVRIVSTGIVQNRQRTIQVDIAMDSITTGTGELRIVSWKEI